MKYKILIADDEAEIRQLLKLYLENEGYEIIEAEDGDDAILKLRDNKPDMCLLDPFLVRGEIHRHLHRKGLIAGTHLQASIILPGMKFFCINDKFHRILAAYEFFR